MDERQVAALNALQRLVRDARRPSAFGTTMPVIVWIARHEMFDVHDPARLTDLMRTAVSAGALRPSTINAVARFQMRIHSKPERKEQ